MINNARFGKSMLLLALLGGLFYLSAWSRTGLISSRSLRPSLPEHPPLYLPSVQSVKSITLGFNSLWSDLLWFNAINYFGKEFNAKQSYRWLYHMCDVVSELDPRASHVYEFCGTLLSWEAKRPEEAQRIFSKAIHFDPTQWRYWYLRGFNSWYFLERSDLAYSDLMKAASLSDAPPFVASLASGLLAETNNPQNTVLVLYDLLKNAKNEDAKSILREKLKQAVLGRDLHFLRTMVENYRTRFAKYPKNLEDLVTQGIATAIPVEPFGGQYLLNPENGELSSSSGKKPLAFAGKTAKTGLWQQLQQAQQETTPNEAK